MGKALKDQAQGLGVDLWDLSWLAGEGGGVGSPGLPKDHQSFLFPSYHWVSVMYQAAGTQRLLNKALPLF